jgi:hypothetical protein
MSSVAEGADGLRTREPKPLTKEDIVIRNPFRTDPRLRYATSIERLLDEATRPVPASMRRFPPIYRRAVVQACAGSLAEIATALRDPKRAVPESALRRVNTFLTDAGRSSLYGDDPAQARWEADWLVFAVAGDTRSAPTNAESLV